MAVRFVIVARNIFLT